MAMVFDSGNYVEYRGNPRLDNQQKQERVVPRSRTPSDTLDTLIRKLEAIPLKEAKFTISVNKPFYPKVLYSRTREDAMKVLELLKQIDKLCENTGNNDVVEVMVTEILDRATFENNYTI
jgi:hypothetical protein